MSSSMTAPTPVNYSEVIERAYKIGEELLLSKEIQQYVAARQQMENDSEAVAQIASFTKMKQVYEEVRRFGKYHPDYKRVTADIRQKKREMDKTASIASFKKAEDNLDELLYRVSRTIADAISDKIKVPSNNPLYEIGGGCGTGGGCSTGGSCGCSTK
ncbi:YlbF family regulator [Aneurinibacillus terranovensis]|uniref:YlbF family regulator n=1 Tax=Aneurinibacillus terranovensis TaxID=278991 RepID=UPI0003F98E16|nr:YlbF family regulator [Aneurinibacillus terranovensis]